MSHEKLRVQTLRAGIDELCNQGWDGWDEAQEELNKLLTEERKRPRDEDNDVWKERFHGLLADWKNENDVGCWEELASPRLLKKIMKECR